ncbi:hypothetical protein QVD17_15148 [Tagetes erecta]|uniref:CASP-like protein n=1 Tax=Tagetes erecta TaxID=13708 RepID=A0AAD8KPE6_TARER|nr:hypothetical protein QVD17_15148 [Tagetes erecta]
MGEEKLTNIISIKRWRVTTIVILLRVLALFATATATIVMALNKETHTFAVATIGNTPVKLAITAKFQHMPANLMFVIANGVATLHSLLMITIMCFVMIAAVCGAATTVAFIGELARHGNAHARWNKVCDNFERYCDQASGAMLASYIGVLFLMLVNVINVFEHGRLMSPSKSPLSA